MKKVKAVAVKVPHKLEPAPSQSVWDEAVVESMLKDLKLGLTLRDTALRHRLRPITVKHWYDANYRRFQERVDEASVEMKRLHLGRVVAAADAKQTGASMWILERRFREEYGRDSLNMIHVNELHLITQQILQILGNHLAEVSPTIVQRIADDIARLRIGTAPVAEEVASGLEE